MNEKDQELADLMRAGRRGDAGAYGLVLTKLAMMVRPRIRRGLGHAVTEAEDVLQEVLLAVHLKSSSWDERLPLMPWVYAITDHKVIDAVRTRYRRDRVIVREVSAETMAEVTPAPSPDPDRANLDIDRHLARLSAKQREVLRALAVEGGTIADVAAALGMSRGAVRVALHRGLKALAAAARLADGHAPPGPPQKRGGTR